MCAGVMLLLPCQGSQPDCMWLRWHLFLVQCLVVVCLAAAVYMPVADAGGTSTAAVTQASVRLERAAVALPGRLVWLHVVAVAPVSGTMLFMACLGDALPHICHSAMVWLHPQHRLLPTLQCIDSNICALPSLMHHGT